TEYQNNMFVGDIDNGLLYRFIPNDARDDLAFDKGYLENTVPLTDREVNDPKENQPIVFGQGFGGISDIEVGPDGYLYVLSYTGSLFKILPSSASTVAKSNVPAIAVTAEDDGEEQSENSDQSNSQNANSVPAVIVGINGDRSYSPNPITIEKGQTIT